ncbi:MAG: hypothetical protein Q9Q13_04090 [Acidobacteriota bacterium]|nr:hypothetical protein [Acidobacteriota bacterium]
MAVKLPPLPSGRILGGVLIDHGRLDFRLVVPLHVIAALAENNASAEADATPETSSPEGP